MRLLLDEMLAPVIATRLRERGHDVEAVKGGDHEGVTDRELLALARSERRALVTNNVVDFRPLHVEAISPGGPGHFGIVFIAGNYRRAKADVGRIVKALEAKLAEYPRDGDLANGETWL